MANYTKATDFASKDALLTGDPNKIVRGTEIDDEFSSIQTAVNSKADTLSPTFTGTPSAPTASAGTSTTQLATTAFVQSTLLAIYPVGSLYISTLATNPNTLLGFGTWTAFGAGKVMVGQDAGDTSFDTLEETGGSKDAIVVSHSHTTSSDGSHSHTMSNVQGALGAGFGYGASNDNTATIVNSTNSAGAHTHTISTTGSSGTNANLQPYVVVKMWKRTA